MITVDTALGDPRSSKGKLKVRFVTTILGVATLLGLLATLVSGFQAFWFYSEFRTGQEMLIIYGERGRWTKTEPDLALALGSIILTLVAIVSGWTFLALGRYRVVLLCALVPLTHAALFLTFYGGSLWRVIT